MKVYTLQVLSHLGQPSFPPSLAEDSHEVKGRQAHNYKCNNFQEIDVPGEALALVTEVQKSVILILCDFGVIVNFTCLCATGASYFRYKLLFSDLKKRKK